MSIALEQREAEVEVERSDPLIVAGDAAIERLPALKSIFDQMAIEFSRSLASAANMPVRFRVGGLTARRVADAQLDARELKLAIVYKCEEFDAKVLFAVNRSFVNCLMEILFGATFAETEADEARAISRIEARAARFAVDQLAASLQTAFAGMASVSLRRETLQTAVDLSCLGRKNSIVVMCTCLLHAFGRSGEACVVLPRSLLDPFRATLSRNPATEGAAVDERWSKKLHDSLVQTEVKVSAVMDKKGLTLRDVMNFEPGRVIELEMSPESLIKLECEGRALYWCNFGQKDGFYTVRIEEFVNESEEFLQDIIGG